MTAVGWNWVMREGQENGREEENHWVGEKDVQTGRPPDLLKTEDAEKTRDDLHHDPECERV